MERSKTERATTATSLIERLVSNGDAIRISNPPPRVRARYRSAIHQAIADGLIPEGFVLRHSGRDKGDLTIRLVAIADTGPHAPEYQPIPVPDKLNRMNPVVVGILDDAQSMRVSESARERALRIVQAISEECSRRQWACTSDMAKGSTLRISVDDDAFTIEVFEEFDRRALPDDEVARAAKYDWQRVPLIVRDAPTGRLGVRFNDRFAQRSQFGDRKRWTLESRLPHFFAAIEASARAHQNQRNSIANALAAQQDQWDEAMRQARSDFLDSYNRDRLSRQVNAMNEAQAIRNYCREALARLEGASIAEKTRGAEWVEWARDQADRLDLVWGTQNLGFDEPEDVSPADLQEFMPPGLSAYRRPS